jgi:hypothetical protein
MSALENKCKPFISKMMRGDPVLMTPAMQRTLALWFLKIAMVMEFCSITGIPSFDPASI